MPRVSIIENKIFRQTGIDGLIESSHIQAAMQEFREEYTAGIYKIDKAQFMATVSFLCNSRYGRLVNTYLEIIGFNSPLLNCLQRSHFSEIVGIQIMPPPQKNPGQGTVADTLDLARSLQGNPNASKMFMDGLEQAIAAQTTELGRIIYEQDSTSTRLRLKALSKIFLQNMAAITNSPHQDRFTDGMMLGFNKLIKNEFFPGAVCLLDLVKNAPSVNKSFKKNLLERFAHEKAPYVAAAMIETHLHAALADFAALTKDIKAFGPVIGPSLQIAARKRADQNETKILGRLSQAAAGHTVWTARINEGIEEGQSLREAASSGPPLLRLRGREEVIKYAQRQRKLEA